MRNRLGRGISYYEVDGDEGRKRGVIEHSPACPKFDGVGNVSRKLEAFISLVYFRSIIAGSNHLSRARDARPSTSLGMTHLARCTHLRYTSASKLNREMPVATLRPPAFDGSPVGSP